ncbi:hypothetical protein [Pseudomonas viridiflava]
MILIQMKKVLGTLRILITGNGQQAVVHQRSKIVTRALLTAPTKKVNSVMLSSTFHDGELKSISVADDKLCMDIYADGKTTRIKLSGLEKLRITDFKEGNIISFLRVLSQDNSPSNRSEVMLLMKYAYTLNDTDLELTPKYSSFLDRKIKEYQDGSLLVMELEPSYGAYAVAIAKELSEEDA